MKKTERDESGHEIDEMAKLQHNNCQGLLQPYQPSHSQHLNQSETSSNHGEKFCSFDVATITLQFTLH